MQSGTQLLIKWDTVPLYIQVSHFSKHELIFHFSTSALQNLS